MATTQSDADELLTVNQVAAALAVEPQTIRAWMRKGVLRYKRVGPRKKIIRITRAELQRQLADGD